MRRTPGAGRYARPECERRFLVRELPQTLDVPWDTEDRYIDGTTLRLRRLVADGETVWKLTQKVRSAPQDPASAAITNMYLSAPVDLPEWLGAEVTHDDRYSGGRLARTPTSDLKSLLNGTA